MNNEMWMRYYQENPDALRSFLVFADSEANKMVNEIERLEAELESANERIKHLERVLDVNTA